MILCEDKTVVGGEREISVVVFPPGCKLGGRRKRRSGNKNHSYIKIGYRD